MIENRMTKFADFALKKQFMFIIIVTMIFLLIMAINSHIIQPMRIEVSNSNNWIEFLYMDDNNNKAIPLEIIGVTEQEAFDMPSEELEILINQTIERHYRQLENPPAAINGIDHFLIAIAYLIIGLLFRKIFSFSKQFNLSQKNFYLSQLMNITIISLGIGLMHAVLNFILNLISSYSSGLSLQFNNQLIFGQEFLLFIVILITAMSFSLLLGILTFQLPTIISSLSFLAVPFIIQGIFFSSQSVQTASNPVPQGGPSSFIVIFVAVMLTIITQGINFIMIQKLQLK